MSGRPAGMQASGMPNSEKNKIDMGISRSISCPLTNKAIGRWNAKTTCSPAQRINESRFMRAFNVRRRFHIEFITNACWCLDRWFVINLLIVRCASLKYTQLVTERQRVEEREIESLILHYVCSAIYPRLFVRPPYTCTSLRSDGE